MKPLREIWIGTLLNPALSGPDCLQHFFRDALLDRAHLHLYRGEALRQRAGDLQKAWQEWKAAQPATPTEDESLAWIEAALRKIEGEVPPS